MYGVDGCPFRFSVCHYENITDATLEVAVLHRVIQADKINVEEAIYILRTY